MHPSWFQTLFVAKDDLELLILLLPPQECKCALATPGLYEAGDGTQALACAQQQRALQLGYNPQTHYVPKVCLELLIVLPGLPI